MISLVALFLADRSEFYLEFRLDLGVYGGATVASQVVHLEGMYQKGTHLGPTC